MDWKKEIKVSDLLRRQDGSAEHGGAPPATTGSEGEDGSVWKKEISLSGLFRRSKKAKQPALPPYGASTASGAGDPQSPQSQPDPSVWKKEIRLSSLFKRKRATQPRQQLALPLPGDTVPEAPTGDEPQAGWETPRADETAPSVEPEAELEAPAGVDSELDEVEEPAIAAQPHDASPDAEEATGVNPFPPGEVAADWPVAEPRQASPSFWKREVPFGRKAKSRKAAPVAAAAAAGAALSEAADTPDTPATTTGPKAPKQSFWKKELGGGSKSRNRSRDAGPERHDEQPSPRDKQPDRGPERAPRAAGKLPDVPLMKAMNLLPKDAQLAATTLRPGVLQAAVVFVAVLLVGAVGLLYVTGKQGVAEKKEILAVKTTELRVLQAQQLPSESDDTTLVGEALARATALSGALQSRMNWDRVLRELSLTLPENVWFESFLTTNPVLTTPVDGSAPPPVPASGLPAGTTLTINGYAASQTDVGYLLSRLSVIPEFSAVQLAQSGRTEIGESQVFKFTVIGTFKQPGQAPQTAQAPQSGQVTP